MQILGESGFLTAGPVGVVHLGDIPTGLNAEELERFLRNMARRLAVSTLKPTMAQQTFDRGVCDLRSPPR